MFKTRAGKQEGSIEFKNYSVGYLTAWFGSNTESIDLYVIIINFIDYKICLVAFEKFRGSFYLNIFQQKEQLFRIAIYDFIIALNVWKIFTNKIIQCFNRVTEVYWKFNRISFFIFLFFTFLDAK